MRLRHFPSGTTACPLLLKTRLRAEGTHICRSYPAPLHFATPRASWECSWQSHAVDRSMSPLLSNSLVLASSSTATVHMSVASRTRRAISMKNWRRSREQQIGKTVFRYIRNNDLTYDALANTAGPSKGRFVSSTHTYIRLYFDIVVDTSRPVPSTTEPISFSGLARLQGAVGEDQDRAAPSAWEGDRGSRNIRDATHAGAMWYRLVQVRDTVEIAMCSCRTVREGGQGIGILSRRWHKGLV
ncbi:hypothetical protein DXG01_003719, partial [Tephrocybe rancida]